MRVVVYAAIALAAVGCGGPAATNPNGGGPGPADAVQEAVGLIRNHSTQFGRGPAKAADLARYESEFPYGLKAVQSGEVVVVWGATVAGEGGGGSEAVVAFAKGAPTQGGAVGLASGRVVTMTAAEFAAAPKAAGKK